MQSPLDTSLRPRTTRRVWSAYAETPACGSRAATRTSSSGANRLRLDVTYRGSLRACDETSTEIDDTRLDVVCARAYMVHTLSRCRTRFACTARRVRARPTTQCCIVITRRERARVVVTPTGTK